jgi:hypothetical protein
VSVHFSHTCSLIFGRDLFTPDKAFGNWRAKFKAEPQPRARKALYRRGGLSHALSHGSKSSGLVMTCRGRAPSSHPRARVVVGGSAKQASGRYFWRRCGRKHASPRWFEYSNTWLEYSNTYCLFRFVYFDRAPAELEAAYGRDTMPRGFLGLNAALCETYTAAALLGLFAGIGRRRESVSVDVGASPPPEARRSFDCAGPMSGGGLAERTSHSPSP